MKIGIIGPLAAGKSTLFTLLTGITGGREVVPQGTAKIPDKRVDTLAGIFSPRKTVHATIEVADFPPLAKGLIDSETASRLRVCDALVMVLRAHDDPSVPWPGEGFPVPADASFAQFFEEMLLTDLCQVESLLEGKKRTPEEIETLRKCRCLLEEMKPLSAVNWSSEENSVLNNYSFLSSRPVLLAVNLSEEQLGSETYEGAEELKKLCLKSGYQMVEFCGTLEEEISRMEKKEQEEYLSAYGLEESGLNRLAAASFELLGLCSFFTVGEDEVRAWTVSTDTPAKKAAGKIHSDIERGFIRAEVISYNELMQLEGSLKKAREHGKLRLEGKEYPVQDGDIINFRFNV